MLERGVYLPPSQFESYFISLGINEEFAQKVIEAACDALDAIHS